MNAANVPPNYEKEKRERAPLTAFSSRRVLLCILLGMTISTCCNAVYIALLPGFKFNLEAMIEALTIIVIFAPCITVIYTTLPIIIGTLIIDRIAIRNECPIIYTLIIHLLFYGLCSFLTRGFFDIYDDDFDGLAYINVFLVSIFSTGYMNYSFAKEKERTAPEGIE